MELITSNNGLFCRMYNFIENLSSTREVELAIPSDIFYRTELMCECVSDELEIDFQIQHFIYALYENFIHDAITKYNPKKILQALKDFPYYGETLNIVINGEKTIFEKNQHKIVNITITMKKCDIKKGELILSEIEELYGYNASFEKLMSAIWIDYIEDYKKGNNKKAYTSIVKLLK